MSMYNSSSEDSDSKYLNENILPVDLQSKNVIQQPFSLPLHTANGQLKSLAGTSYSNGTIQPEPYVVISEQPQQRGFRFRYECEGPSHGGLQGTKSERSRKSYPSIKIENYTGAARVVVSLVTDEKTPRSHAHKLVGTSCTNGLCTVEIKSNVDCISFPNLCILHVTRKRLVDVLTERNIDSIILNKKVQANNMNVDPPITDEDKRIARQQAEEQSKTMQLNVVRLCFQVFLRNPDGSLGKLLPPVVSHPIYDSKSPGASALKICRMDKYGGCCSGNEEVFLLCEKVQKDDIQVRFVEQNPDGSVKWEAFGNFGPLDVHRQYAIVFKTPAYWNTMIDKAVNVLIMLQRKSDQEVSEPKAFTYFPQNRDKDNIASKKRKRIPLDGYDFGGDGSQGGSGMGDGGLGGMGHNGGNGGVGMCNGPGSGGGGGGNMIGSNEMVMHNYISIPTMVEEAAREEFERNNRVLDSQVLRARLDRKRDNSSSMSSDNDPWFSTDDGDIEVDAAIMPTSPATSKMYEHNETLKKEKLKSPLAKEYHTSPARPSEKSPSNKDDKTSPRRSPSNKDDKTSPRRSPSNKDDKTSPGKSPSNKDEKTRSPQDVILEWVDSGVDPGSGGKSLVSLEEKKIVSSHRVKHSNTEISIKEESEDGGQRKSLSSSDEHLEPDVKMDVNSEGVRSDEGFSETSEEAGLKGQQMSPNKVVPGSVPSNQSSETSTTHCQQLTEKVRQVTGRVAERTLAALTDFAETGDIRHLLLVQRHLLAVSNKNGDLSLHLTVINSQIEALKGLLDVMCTLPESKRHINSLNLLRQTPLHLASVMNQEGMVELLLHAGADPTIADRNGNTPAHLAVLNNAEKCLKILVKYLRPGQSQFNPFPELNYLNYDGYSPVHLAAMAGSVDMLQLLVFAQALVDLPDGKSGKTALHHAVDNGDLPVASYLLLEAQADVNARCFDGNTALHIACARQLVGMVALLVTAGADLNCENEEIPDPDLGGEENSCINRRGLRPVDYADDNEQILRILFGEANAANPPPSDDSDELTSRLSMMSVGLTSDWLTSLPGKTINDSGLESYLPSSAHRGVSELCTKTRMDLSRLLDPPQRDKDVIALAEKLGFSNLTSSLVAMRSSHTSPTDFLLEYFETVDGNLNKLKESLCSIGREDVASLIQ